MGPRWAHSGRELFYRTLDDEMTVATVEMGESFRVTDRQPLFSIPLGFSLGTFVVLYDITSDDQEFIMVRAVGSSEEVEPPLILVENWLEEVKVRVEGGGR